MPRKSSQPKIHTINLYLHDCAGVPISAVIQWGLGGGVLTCRLIQGKIPADYNLPPDEPVNIRAAMEIKKAHNKAWTPALPSILDIEKLLVQRLAEWRSLTATAPALAVSL